MAAITRYSEATVFTVVIASAAFMGTAATSTIMVSTTEVTSGIFGILGTTAITWEIPTTRVDSRFSSAAAIHTTADSPYSF